MPKNHKKMPGPLRTLLFVKNLVWEDKSSHLHIYAALFLMLCMVALNVGVPLVFRYSISLLTAKPIPTIITAILIAYGVLWTLSQITTQVRSFIINLATEKSINQLSLKLFDKLHALSLRFHLERRTGAVSHVINRAQQGVEGLYWGLFLFMIPTVLEILLAVAVIGYLYGTLYAFSVSFILLLYIVVSSLGLQWSHRAHEAYNEKRSSTKAFIVDSILNFETVKYFTNQTFEHKQCKKALEQQSVAAYEVNKESTVNQMLQSLVIGGGLAALTWVSGKAVINGSMQVSDFVLINGYIIQFVMPLSYFGYLIQQIRKGVVDLGDALALLETKPEIIDSPQALDYTTTNATIRFEHVSFSFESTREILKDVSFTVPAGKTVALVGPTGSGKSTIARLLFRFYDVTAGAIYINDHDIRTIKQQSLQKLMGIVPQDTVLFNNTILYNIAYGKPGATQQEVEQAIQLAHLESFINRLPEGYDTKVGERGLKVSGGEKQRIAIARVIIKKPVVYIFDEATSALDTTTEKEIQQHIKEVSAGSTTVIIAHRLSTIVDADEILVFDMGRIVERGSHAELLKINRVYACLWQQQAKQAECSVLLENESE